MTGRIARSLPDTASPSGDRVSRAIGADVLRQEAAALQLLADGLGADFERALDILSAISGRAIVTGMGKSGHVARKIAATFASTGQPALFVHPAEASHGDLGMIAPGDAVLALSNSGESAELADILAYSRRWKIPLIAMTSGTESSLAGAADLVLALPRLAEAGSLGLAPTTSTTMMLALGDALAVALLERRGFSAEDFRRYHPGGKLGKKLLRVQDLMHGGERVPLIGAGEPMAQAILEMTAKSFGCVGVVAEDGRLIGIVTDGDLRRHMGPDLLNGKVAAIMTPAPRAIAAKSLAAEALGEMNARAITSLFVTENGRPIGIIHMHDCLRAGLT